jgi:hypothetical protein
MDPAVRRFGQARHDDNYIRLKSLVIPAPLLSSSRPLTLVIPAPHHRHPSPVLSSSRPRTIVIPAPYPRHPGPITIVIQATHSRHPGPITIVIPASEPGSIVKKSPPKSQSSTQ